MNKFGYILSSCLFFALLAVPAFSQTTDDLIFLHHSCGSNWLSSGLHTALLAKSYIDERNDITYGSELSPDNGRPASLGATPGNYTDMNHWILWFNDYLEAIKAHGCEDGENKIIMFKSCYPTSNIYSEGTEPGDPFSATHYTVNYKAVYRHPNGSGNTYQENEHTYYPLEDIFAANPNTLFIVVTAPPRHYGSTGDATNDDEAQRARDFNNWLKGTWLSNYNIAHPGLYNVAVFDWFNILAYPADHASHPNRLKEEYGGNNNNSHPNTTANTYTTELFATNQDNFIDTAWDYFDGTVPVELAAFTALATTNGIEINWSTASEHLNFGWHIYRSGQGAESGFERINGTIVPGYGTTAESHAYHYTDANAKPGVQYWYRLYSVDVTGNMEPHGPVTVKALQNNGPVTPQDYVLGNYPNPFNGSTKIRYTVPVSGMVNIDIYDTRGAHIAHLLHNRHDAGIYETFWQANGLPSGTYFCRINGTEWNRTLKLLYLK